MHVFMQFVFNTDTLREHLREPWMSCYDFEYIDSKIIGGIEKALPSVSDILRVVERRATGKITSQLSQSSSMREGVEGDQSQRGAMNTTGGLSRVDTTGLAD